MDPVGVAVVVAVLVLGVAIGLRRRFTDGRLVGARRPVAPDDPQGTAVDDRRDGDRGDGDRLDAGLLERLGVGPAEATLLQFSSAFCAPCRALRRVSDEVAGMVPGVQHVEVDAESHLDEVRALNIWRTPTLLVLDGAGRVTRRAAGVPTKPQLLAAVGEILPGKNARVDPCS